MGGIVFTARASAAPQMDLKWLLRKFPDSPQQNYHTRLCILDLHRQFGAGAFFITLAPGMYRMPCMVCDPGQVSEYMVKLCRYVGKDVSGLDEHWLENASSGLAAAYTYLHRSKPSTMKMVDLLSRASNVHFSCYTKEVMLNLPTETWRSDLVQKYMRCPLRKNICYLDWRGPIIANWCDVWRNIVHTLQKTLQAHSCKSVHEVPLVKHFSYFV